MDRRNAIRSIGSLAGSVATSSLLIAGSDKFRLRYILSSAMYGYMPLESILPQVSLTGSEAIDVWCKVHGNQREQIDKMSHSVAKDLLAKNKVKGYVYLDRLVTGSIYVYPPTPSGSPGVWYRCLSFCPSCCPPLVSPTVSLIVTKVPDANPGYHHGTPKKCRNSALIPIPSKKHENDAQVAKQKLPK